MRVEAKTFVIDANVILRYVLQDDHELSPKADAIMDALADGKVRLRCDPVTLAEIVWVLVGHYRLPAEKIQEELEPLLRHDGFALRNKQRYILALRLFASSVPHFGDACACAAALEDCEGRFFSFDHKLSHVPGVQRFESPLGAR